MDELDITNLDTVPATTSVSIQPFGVPVTAGEVEERLSRNLYIQLSEDRTATTEAAINRAQIYVGAVMRRLNVPFSLNDQIIREVVLIHTIYELHIALGHEEAGREYRTKAKDIILAAYGDYPDTDDKTPAKAPAGAAVRPQRNSRYRQALMIGDRHVRY